MLEWINQNSGLFSLLAVVASVIVPIAIFKKQRKDDKEAEQRRIQEIRRLNVKKIANASTLARCSGLTDELEETTYLKMKSKRR